MFFDRLIARAGLYFAMNHTDDLFREKFVFLLTAKCEFY